MPDGRERLETAEIDGFLASREGARWALVDGRLHRELRFRDFAEAFGFMASVAIVAERLDHHPDWTNVWNRVVIDLSTHTLGGLSSLDLALAREIAKLAGDR